MAEDAPMEVENPEKENYVNEIINNLIQNDDIYFKSQQRDEQDLTLEQKRDIATDIFSRSKAIFLCRFGKFLKEEQLEFFQKYLSTDEGYEIDIHLQNLRRYFSQNKRNIDIKNRRYCALSELAGDSYFSETEMMRRNPLLYDHLVGQYMTEDEKKTRDNIDTENITFVNLLLESIDRKACKEKQLEQEKYEDSVMEEYEDSSGEETEQITDKYEETVDKTTKWGEFIQNEPSTSQTYIPKPKKPAPMVTATERRLLKEEFFSTMYQDFIDGKDKDFDYSTVDNNEKYDNIDIKNIDAEEKYFDSESPEELPIENKMEDVSDDEVNDASDDKVDDESDDLDLYMKSIYAKLKQCHNMKVITNKMNNL